MEVGLGPGDFVLDGDPSPQKKGTAPPNFWPMTIMATGKTTGWIKMPLGTEVNVVPGEVVLDGVAAPPLKGTHPPVFGSCLL